jgi:Cu-Zn family superoxide dismutase
MAVALFKTRSVRGEVTFDDEKRGVRINATFTQLPGEEHGFHIHKAGDLRGEGCKLACDHFHVGPPMNHGGPPGFKGERHTGDLGNVSVGSYTYLLRDIAVSDLLGRSVIVHADRDDYGFGDQPDSLETGHSGKRIACAIIGRTGH